MPGSGRRRASTVGALVFLASLTSCTEERATSYRWTGYVWGRSDLGGAKACFGPGRPSLPPGECVGWPLDEFDWSTAPGVTDYSEPGRGIPTAPIRTASVTLVGHPEGGAFVLDEPPTPVVSATIPHCSDLEASPGPVMTMGSAFEVLVAGHREGKLWMTASDPSEAGIDVGAADPDAPDPLTVNLLINDAATRAWIAEHVTGIRIQLCGVLTAA